MDARCGRRRARGSAGPGSGPGCSSPRGALAQRALPALACSAGRRPSAKTVSDGSYSMPMIASRPLGTMFHVTGTAATQYSRTAADAAGRRHSAAAPTRWRPRAVAARLTDDDRPVHERVDQAVELYVPGRAERHRVAAPAAASPCRVSITPEFQNPLPCSVGRERRAGVPRRLARVDAARVEARRLERGGELARGRSRARFSGSPGPERRRVGLDRTPAASGTSASCPTGTVSVLGHEAEVLDAAGLAGRADVDRARRRRRGCELLGGLEVASRPAA